MLRGRAGTGRGGREKKRRTGEAPHLLIYLIYLFTLPPLSTCFPNTAPTYIQHNPSLLFSRDPINAT